MVKVWLDKKPEDPEKPIYIDSGNSPPPVPSAEKRYEYLGVISGRAEIEGKPLIGYVTAEEVIRAIDEKRELFQEHIENLDGLESNLNRR